MRTTSLAVLTSALMAFGLGATPASAADMSGPDVVYPVVTVSGTEAAKRSLESYIGFYAAFNGDLDREGFLIRALGSMGRSDYRTDAGKVDSDLLQGDILVGYQWVRNGMDFSAMIGIDYQNYDLSPDDPFNKLRGDEVGFKAALDLETSDSKSSPFYLAARGSYSTAFNSYYALGRVGMNIGRAVIGPEAWLLGDDSGDAQRLGGFLLIDFPFGISAGQVSFSAGYQFADGSNSHGHEGSGFGEEGMYGTVKFRMALGRESSLPAPLK